MGPVHLETSCRQRSDIVGPDTLKSLYELGPSFQPFIGRCLVLTCFIGIWQAVSVGMCAESGSPPIPPPAAPPAAESPEPETIPEPPPVGPSDPQIATIGIQLAPLSARIPQLRMPLIPEGALIVAILTGSPADRAGLPLGGILVAIDGRKVSTPADAARIIRGMAPGTKVELKYYDGPRLFRKSLYLAPLNEVIQAPSAPQSSQANDPQSQRDPPPQFDPTIERDPTIKQRRVLEGNGRPMDGLAFPDSIPPGVAPWGTDQRILIGQLRDQVEDLRSQVRELQLRVRELERQVPAAPRTDSPR